MVFERPLTMRPDRWLGYPTFFYNSSRSHLSPWEGAPIMYGTARQGGSQQD